MAVKWGFRRAGGAKWRENGGTRTPSNVEFPAVSGVVCMSKVGGLDENYPLTKIYVRWMRFCVYKVAWHRPTLCHLALSQEVGFPLETGMRLAVAGAARREESIAVEFLKIGSLDQMLWLRDADRVHRVPCYTGLTAISISAASGIHIYITSIQGAVHRYL